MNIVNITLGVDTQPCSSITLGRRGENEVTQVVVDFSSWVEEFGAGVITLLAMRSQDTSAYPVVLTLSSNTATWDVTSTDTAYKGSGRAEFIYTVGEQIAKSVVFNTVVMQDIGEPSETPPDPYEEWLERLTELGAETQANAEAAQQSAEDAEQSAQEAAQEAANAEGYAEQAGEYASAAQSAEAASESARDEAQTAQASAEASATAASGSAASAAGSATAAAGSASDASASATAAGASATTASTAAGQAEAAKTAAQAAQSAAEDAAADAQQAAQQAHVEYEQLSGEVDDLDTEVSRQKSAIDDLTALVDRKAGMLVDTASGAVASFVPDATIENLLGVTVNVEPVQDLHGFDSPWPAGGGRNKLPYATIESPLTKNGITFAINQDGSIAVNGTSTASFAQTFVEFALQPGSYYFNCGNGISRQNYTYIYIRDVDNSRTLAEINAGNIGIDRTFSIDAQTNVRFYMVFGTSDLGISGTLYPMIRLATETDATYAPYENLCPISGWDAVELYTTSINAWDEEWESGQFNGNPNTGIIGKAQDSTRIRTVNDFPVMPLTTYYVHSPQPLFAYFLDSEKVWINRVGSNGTTLAKNATFTTPENCRFIKFFTINTPTYNHDISINYPSADHDYHPYSGNRYTITLGQTVYGGTLTIAEDGSVNALVDRARVVYDGSDDETWERHSSGSASAFAMKISLVHAFISSNANIISNYLTAISSSATWGNYDNWISSSSGGVLNTGIKSITDVTTWRAYLANNQLEVCYELATPITIQLDPVQIAAIAGQTNSVWSDAGDVSVEFAADVKTYIDQKIAAAVAALS